MCKLVMLLGLVMAAVGCNVVGAAAQRPAMGNHRPLAVGLMTQDSEPAPDPILPAMAQRLRTAFKHGRLPLRVHLDGDVLVAEFHTHHANVHLRDMTGRESPRLTDLVVPADDGMLLQLQLEPADYIDQAIRPQTRHESYRTDSADKRLKWTTYLGQEPLKKAKRSLLISFAYGAHVDARWVTAIKTAVRNYESDPAQGAFVSGVTGKSQSVK